MQPEPHGFIDLNMRSKGGMLATKIIMDTSNLCNVVSEYRTLTPKHTEGEFECQKELQYFLVLEA